MLAFESANPKDKAKVGVGVQVAERWIPARLRNCQLVSLGELNMAIALQLGHLHHNPFKKLLSSRRAQLTSATH